jgi:hypothetical protein
MAGIMSNSSFGRVPSGTTANRPASPAVGDQYYNGTVGALEVYTSNGWKSLTTSGGNTAGRPANPYLGQLYSNGEVGRLELYTSTGWQNIVQETPGIASITGTYNESAGSGTFVISGTNFVTGGIAYAVGTNAVEYQASSSVTNSIVQMTATFTGLSPAHEPYDVKVLNPSNLFGLLPDAFFINDTPIWSTTAGSLGSFPSGSVSIQLSATDDETTPTYSISSGALPSGLSLSSSGLISGTVTATPATYTFTVAASDGVNTAQTRSFSINVPFPTVTGGTLTSDATYYYRAFTANGNLITNGALSADIFVLAGGGGANGNGNACGGGGSGGFRTSTAMSFVPGTYQALVGSGGSGSSDGSSATNGNNSSINNFSATGGGKSNTSGGAGGGGNRDGSTSGASGNAGSYNPVEGYGGGTTSPMPYGGAGGGGGAGGAGLAGGGGSATAERGGVGGIGRFTTLTNEMALATSTGVLSSGNYYYGGGGGGGSENGARSGRPAGGLGGGGLGCEGSNSPATAGSVNTGSGGGGAGISSGAGAGGGSGIVIVRYTKSSVGG